VVSRAPGSRFHVLRAWTRFKVLSFRTRFRRYRWRRVSFLSFVRPDSFSMVSRALGSYFQVLRSQTRFWQYSEHRVPFSFFARPNSFSAVPMALGPVFIFCAPGLIFGGTAGIGSHSQVLCSQTHFFCDTEGVGSNFIILRVRALFRRYRRRRHSFSCCELPDSFSTVPRASTSVFMFCASGLVFGGTEGFWSRFHLLRSWTHFQRYRGHLVPFSCLSLPVLFSAVPSVSGHIFMFCVPGLIFGVTEVVRSRFHDLRSHSRFPRYRGCQVPFSYFALPD
jgi:hypothetical protein